MRAMGKIGVRASGPRGSPVAGFRGGDGGDGMSGMMLYHWVGISFSLKTILVSSTIRSFLLFSSCRHLPPFRSVLSLGHLSCSPTDGSPVPSRTTLAKT
jgi:hypothetical protein